MSDSTFILKIQNNCEVGLVNREKNETEII